MAVMKYLPESVFSCRLRQSLFFVKLQTFNVNGSDRVCGRISFNKVQIFAINGSNKVSNGVYLSEASGHYYERQCTSLAYSVTEFDFSLKLWQRLFFVKL